MTGDAPTAPRAGGIPDTLRFAVPWGAQVAVLVAAGEQLPELGIQRPGLRLDAGVGGDRAARLEELREDGCEYLVVPAASLGLLDGDPGLAGRLKSVYTHVTRDLQCAVWSLHPPPPAAAAPDGFPLPPAHLIRVTSGCARAARRNPARMYQSYLDSGAEGARCIREALGGVGVEVGSCESILDFGCGCGRIVRHWHDLGSTAVSGCDYNPLLVQWCAQALPFASFQVNGPDPALPYDDGEFGFIYSISVFTHLEEELQVPWMRELARVTRPGGVVLVTVSGEDRAREEQGPRPTEVLPSGLIIRPTGASGQNAFSAYHSESYVRDTLAGDLDVLAIMPGGARDVRQDQILLRKPQG